MGELLLEFPSRSTPSNASVQTALERDMDQFFSLVTPAPVELEHEDGWDEIVPVKNDEASPIRHQGSPSVQATSQVPALESLPKPTDLFKVTLPYILRVDARTSPLVVECSHQQSLDLLVAYLGRWAKTNMRDSLKVRSESKFQDQYIDVNLTHFTIEASHTEGNAKEKRFLPWNHRSSRNRATIRQHQ